MLRQLSLWLHCLSYHVDDQGIFSNNRIDYVVSLFKNIILISHPVFLDLDCWWKPLLPLESWSWDWQFEITPFDSNPSHTYDLDSKLVGVLNFGEFLKNHFPLPSPFSGTLQIFLSFLSPSYLYRSHWWFLLLEGNFLYRDFHQPLGRLLSSVAVDHFVFAYPL